MKSAIKTDAVADYYQKLGFSRNPFETNTAEREPEIELYAVRPPYLDPVEEASKHTSSYTLSGTRGSGKSATRITVHRNIWKLPKPHPLAIALTNFSRMRGETEPETLLNLYAGQVMFLTVEAALIHLTSLDQADQNSISDNLNGESKRLRDWCIQTFYLSRSERERTISAQECFSTFSVSFARRSKLWAEKKWDALTESLLNITNAIAKKFDVDIGETEAYKALLSTQASPNGSDPLFVLKKAVEFSRAMGFSGVLIQVDKIDETDWTTNDADLAAKLVWPIYSNVQLHEIDGLAWSFFLWDRVKELLTGENNMPVRWDKLTNDRIKWDKRHLKRLVERRIEYFSNSNLKSLDELFEPGTDKDEIYTLFFSVSGLSPRTLVTVINSVFTNHIHMHEGQIKPLNLDSVQAGLDSYAKAAILNEYSADTISQLQKLGLLTFVTKDVAKAFTIGQQGARQKIEKWINSGLASRNGQVFAGERAKPVDQFVISEPRTKRIIERNLDIRDE